MAASRGSSAGDTGHCGAYGLRSYCFNLLCLRCSSPGRRSRIGYRPLLHEEEDDHEENCWDRARRSLITLLPNWSRRLRWRALLSKIVRRCGSRIVMKKTRRRRMFQYDSASYKLNFDEGEEIDCC